MVSHSVYVVPYLQKNVYFDTNKLIVMVDNQLANRETQRQTIANAATSDKSQRFCEPINRQSDWSAFHTCEWSKCIDC